MTRLRKPNSERLDTADIYPGTDWTALERLVLINALVNARKSASKEARGLLDHFDRFIEMLSRETAAVLEMNRAKILEQVPETVRSHLRVNEKTLRFLSAR
jgi:hypothetical protein